MREQTIENIKVLKAKKARNKAQKKKSSSLLTQSNVKELPLSQEQLKLKMNLFEIDNKSIDNKLGVLFDNLISVEELAVIFGLAPQTIRNWIALGKIPSIKLGRRHVFQKRSLQEWLNRKEESLWQ